MAKVVGPLHSTEARGRVDSLVYNTYRGIRWVKAWAAPVFAEPDCRLAQIARIHAANHAWKALSDVQRQAWHAYAQQHPRLDWTGVLIRITGFNAFCACYTIVSRVGGTPLNDPPATFLPLPPDSLTLSQTDNNIRIAWTYPTQLEPHTYYAQIKRSGPTSLGKSADFHQAVIQTHELIDSSPCDDPLTLDGKYHYWVRTVDGDTGEVTPYLVNSQPFVFTPPAPPTGGITGICQEDSTPVPDILVETNGYSDTTDENGVFLMELLPPGLYIVTPDALAGPWHPTTKEVLVVADQQTDAGYFTRTPP